MFGSKPIRILSIDGGGIRGLIPALILSELEKLTQKPISDLFDLIVGTSTGSILALGLTKPDTAGNPAYTADKLVEFYESEGPKIFQAGLWYRSKAVGNLNGPKYPSETIESLLTNYFGDTRLDQAIKPVLVTAYEIERRLAWLFKSQVAKNQTEKNFLMSQVARASSAAPTYFPPAKITTITGNNYYSFVDGGVFANNPAMCALVEAKKMFPKNKKFLLVSLGTGYSNSRIHYEEIKDWGMASWAQPLLKVVFDGANDMVDYQVSQILATNSSENSYYRFQTKLDKGNDKLDDASAKNLRNLRLITEELIKNKNTELNTLARQLIK